MGSTTEAVFWLLYVFGLGLLAGVVITWRFKVPIRVQVDEGLIRWYIESHGYVLMPKGPEWIATKPKEKNG